jgi:hypothetical protein
MYTLHPDAKEITVEYGVELVKVFCNLPGDPSYTQVPTADRFAAIACDEKKNCIGFWINLLTVKEDIGDMEIRAHLAHRSVRSLVRIVQGLSLKRGVSEEDLEAYELMTRIAALPILREEDRPPRRLVLLR